MPEASKAEQPQDQDTFEGEDRRSGAKDRRVGDKDRRNAERIADEIAPRRHPDVKGRRETDR